MNRKQFAAAAQARSLFSEIETTLAGVKGHPTKAYNACMEVLAKVEKWNNDFQNCDPGWRPNNADIQPVDPVALGAYVQR